MSNLVVDDILFYHGGAADLGIKVKVIQNFGPIEANCIGYCEARNFREKLESTIEQELKNLAQQADKMGANSVICYSKVINPWGFSGSEKPHYHVHLSGDAVTLTPKET